MVKVTLMGAGSAVFSRQCRDRRKCECDVEGRAGVDAEVTQKRGRLVKLDSRRPFLPAGVVPIRFKILAYYRVRSAFKANCALPSDKT